MSSAKRHDAWRRMAVVPLCALALALSACSQDATGNPSASDPLPYGKAADGSWLSFYLDQTGITTPGTDGENTELHFYKTALAKCTLPPVKRLGAADEAKVGTTRMQYWSEGDQRQALLVESWSARMGNAGSPCEFSLERQAKLEITYPSKGTAYSIDLAQHTGTRESIPAAGPDARLHDSPPNWGELKQSGVTRADRASELGKPCQIVRDQTAHITACVWSGGEAWGYGVQNVEQFPAFEGTPTLWIKSGSGKTIVATNHFEVGKLSDTRIFAIPGNVSIRDLDKP